MAFRKEQESKARGRIHTHPYGDVERRSLPRPHQIREARITGVHAKLRYAQRSAKKRENIPKDSLFKCRLGYLLNRGEFGLPTKYVQERGIKGEDTISRAKKRLVEIGFLDVVDQGSFAKAGRFRYSDRWRNYNSGNLSKENGDPIYDGPMPGYCHYPNIIQFNRSRSANNQQESGGYTQLELFPELIEVAQ
ncbi:hypothetical protein ACFL2Q_06105 [Thermodesulfobacteriota bacterium]